MPIGLVRTGRPSLPSATPKVLGPPLAGRGLFLCRPAISRRGIRDLFFADARLSARGINGRSGLTCWSVTIDLIVQPFLSSTCEFLCCAALLTHGSRHSARRLVRHVDRCLGHPSTALQDSFEIVTKQVALRSNEFLRGSATHEGVYSLYIVIQTLSAKPGEFAGEAL